MDMREKVIKGLEQFVADFKPFCGNKADWQRVYDALALLKAQEPVKPVYGLGITRCGQCNHEIDKYGGDRYCPQCGKAVKWE